MFDKDTLTTIAFLLMFADIIWIMFIRKDNAVEDLKGNK